MCWTVRPKITASPKLHNFANTESQSITQLIENATQIDTLLIMYSGYRLCEKIQTTFLRKSWIEEIQCTFLRKSWILGQFLPVILNSPIVKSTKRLSWLSIDLFHTSICTHFERSIHLTVHLLTTPCFALDGTPVTTLYGHLMCEL